MSFASDNWAGASDAVMAAMAEANSGLAPSYGSDPWSERAIALLSSYFEKDVGVVFVATGSAANALSLAHIHRPGGTALVHIDSHVARDEAGAPHFFAPGMVIDEIDGPHGRLPLGAVTERIESYGGGDPRHGRPLALSFANVNELGQSYAPAEVAGLASLAHRHKLKVHVDGARFANAVAHTGASPADLTWRSGVDILSLGFTKAGAWCAEAVIFFDPAEAEEAAYRQKTTAQMVSKTRFIAAQFVAMLTDHHAHALAAHANGKAAELAALIEASAGAALAAPCQANEVFAHLSPRVAAALADRGINAYPWGVRSQHVPHPPENDWRLHRFVTSFRTGGDEIGVARTALNA